MSTPVFRPLRAVPFSDNPDFSHVRTAGGFFTVCMCNTHYAGLFAASVELLGACRAADKDVEQTGNISENTVLQLRAALDKVKGAA